LLAIVAIIFFVMFSLAYFGNFEAKTGSCLALREVSALVA